MSSKRTINPADLIESHRDKTEDTINSVVGEIFTIVVDTAEADDVDHFTLGTLEEMRDKVKQIAHGSHTTAGRDNVLSGRPVLAAIGSGSNGNSGSTDDTPSGLSTKSLDQLQRLADGTGKTLDEFVDYQFGIFAALFNDSQEQAKVRAAFIPKVADGSFALEGNGTPVLQTEKDAVAKQLREEKDNAAKAAKDAKTELDKANAETKTEKERADKAEQDLRDLKAKPVASDPDLIRMLDEIRDHGKFRFQSSDVLRVDFPSLSEDTQKRVHPKK